MRTRLLKSLSIVLAGAALAALLTGCVNDPEDDGPFAHKDGPRSISKGTYRNTELAYSFTYPKTWYGGLIKDSTTETVAFWADYSSSASVTVRECPAEESVSLCKTFMDADRQYGVPGVQMRQGVEVIVNITTDTTHVNGVNKRMHFRRGDQLVMIWMDGSSADFETGTGLQRIDSSLTFF
jgi:hypothetical protein